MSKTLIINAVNIFNHFVLIVSLSDAGYVVRIFIICLIQLNHSYL